MQITVPYITKVSDNQWIYRRKVPHDLREALGKREVKVPLGRTEHAALKAYAAVHKKIEADFINARNGGPAAPISVTALDRFKEAQAKIRALGLDPEWRGESGTEAIARDVIADQIAAMYPRDDEDQPVGLKPSDAALLQALAYGAHDKAPSPTLEDVRKLYLKERVRDDEKKQKQLDLVFGYLTQALGSDRKLVSLKREDAKEVRDYMLDGRGAATVERYLNTVRAAFNHAIKEWDLTWRNPFMGLEVELKDKAAPDRDKRKPFPTDMLPAMQARLADRASVDLRWIWQMLEGTGARLSEIAGLRTEDVKVDDPIPHIVVEWHDDRRIKNKVSRRRVPLIGDALAAAKEALKDAGSRKLLFPSYGRVGGGSTASAALGKHVRAVVTDTKVTTHSLRHLMKDRLRIAGVSKSDQDILLGHSSGSVGEDYGGDEGRLKVALRALEEALDAGGSQQ